MAEATSTIRVTQLHRDLTRGSLLRHVISLSGPSALEMALTNIAMLVDAFWLRRVGGVALAAVTMGLTLRIVLISPMMGLSAGGLALVARFMGSHEQRQADRAVMQTLLLVVAFVTPITIIGQLGAPTFLRWMGAKGELLEASIAYLRIIFAGLIFLECLPSMNGVIRGAGHPEYTMRISMVNVIVVLILDPVLILGLGPFPAMGVRGAAIASVSGAAAGVLAQFITLLSGKAGVRLHLADVRPDLGIMRRIMRIAFPNSAERLSPNLANAILLRLVSALGTDVLTAYSLANRIATFLLTPSMGIALTSATLVGQNLGANQPDRAGKAVRLTGLAAILLSVVLFGIVNLAPHATLGLFEHSPDVLATAIMATRFLMASSVGLAWATVVGRSFAGAGDALTPMCVNIASLWIFEIPLCWFLSQPMGLGAAGVYGGMVVGNWVCALAMRWFFGRGRWRTQRV